MNPIPERRPSSLFKRSDEPHSSLCLTKVLSPAWTKELRHYLEVDLPNIEAYLKDFTWRRRQGELVPGLAR